MSQMNRPWCNNNMPNVKMPKYPLSAHRQAVACSESGFFSGKTKTTPQSNVDVIGLGLITMTTVQFGGS